MAITRVALLGDDAATRTLEQLFQNNPSLGFRVVRRFSASELDKLPTGEAEADEVLVGEAGLPHEVIAQVLEHCVTHHLGFRYVADMFEAQSHNVVTHTLAGLPIIEIKRTPLDGWGRVAKRTFDLVVSAVLLAVLSPIMLLTALAIVIDSGFPVFWHKFDDGSAVKRIGEHGRPFRYFKFRSMRNGTHSLRYTELASQDTRQDGPLVKIQNDPRVTAVGRFIRRYSIDELPELFLVLSGRMSLVGPRPHLPEEVARYSERQRRVLNIKPGITGLAQISGRDHLNFDEEVRLDAFYIENWSLGSDLVILVKTLVVVFQHKPAV
jgi:exopolysaccharide biosynthesis polyprenyl glycosylphosphotransferase